MSLQASPEDELSTASEAAQDGARSARSTGEDVTARALTVQLRTGLGAGLVSCLGCTQSVVLYCSVLCCGVDPLKEDIWSSAIYKLGFCTSVSADSQPLMGLTAAEFIPREA